MCCQQASLRALLNGKRYKGLADSIFTVVVGLSFASAHSTHARQQEHMAQRFVQALHGTPNCMGTWHTKLYGHMAQTPEQTGVRIGQRHHFPCKLCQSAKESTPV